MGSTVKDITGQRFERLLVIGLDSRDKGGRTYWLCRCDCGIEKTVRKDSLIRNSALSCGCLGAERSSARERRHGLSHTHIHVVWQMLLQRCLNPNSTSWERYGGRGIKVCERWLVFENFLADMGEPPPGMTLDRFPNRDGNYEPGNCRWATGRQQSANKTGSLSVELDGFWIPFADYARSIGKRYSTVYRWYSKGVLKLKVRKQE
jgi:hypothetical protein